MQHSCFNISCTGNIESQHALRNNVPLVCVGAVWTRRQCRWTPGTGSRPPGRPSTAPMARQMSPSTTFWCRQQDMKGLCKMCEQHVMTNSTGWNQVASPDVCPMSQVRMRQVMSIIESQWSNASIVVVSPGALLPQSSVHN